MFMCNCNKMKALFLLQSPEREKTPVREEDHASRDGMLGDSVHLSDSSDNDSCDDSDEIQVAPEAVSWFFVHVLLAFFDKCIFIQPDMTLSISGAALRAECPYCTLYFGNSEVFSPVGLIEHLRW